MISPYLASSIATCTTPSAIVSNSSSPSPDTMGCAERPKREVPV